jgi:hypothetical protein
MSDPELPDVPSLAVLEPPAGGLARLQATLDASPSASPSSLARVGRWLAVPVVALAAVALWFALRREAAPVAAPPGRPELVADPAIAPRFYWVASTPVRPTGLSPVGAPPPTVAYVALPR